MKSWSRTGAWWLALVVIAGVLGCTGAAVAQPAALALSLTTNQAVFAPGETLVVSIGVQNPGLAATADLFFGARLPDGDTVVFFAGPALTPGFGRLSNLAALKPQQAGVGLATPFTTTTANFFSYTWTGGEPFGQYLLFFAAVKPGALADGRLDGGDLLALATARVTLGPPVTLAVDPSLAASALITPQGGTVQTTGPGGRTYTLTVPRGLWPSPPPSPSPR